MKSIQSRIRRISKLIEKCDTLACEIIGIKERDARVWVPMGIFRDALKVARRIAFQTQRTVDESRIPS